MGIKVLTPDINRSVTDFAALAADEVPDRRRRCPPAARARSRSACRRCATSARASSSCSLGERDANGPFTSFHDFAERVPEPVLNKRTVESLIKAGAFDSLGHPRQGLLIVFEQIIDTTLVRRRERDQGVMSLFGDWASDAAADAASTSASPIPDIEFDKSDRLRVREGDARPLRVATTRCSASRRRCGARSTARVAELAERDDGAAVVRRWRDHRPGPQVHQEGDQMAVFVLEDLEAAIEVTVFPRMLMEQGHKLGRRRRSSPCKGRLDRRDESRIGLIGSDIDVLEGLGDRPGAGAARCALPATSLDELRIQRLKRILRDHPGDSPVLLDLGRPRCCASPTSSASTSTAPSASCGWPSATTP